MTELLAGRLALITGGSGGIGRALATALADAGCDVVLTYADHRAEAEDAAVRVRASGGTAHVIRADLQERGAGRQLARQVSEEHGPVDLLVANAGAGTRRRWEEVDDELWEDTLAVNLTAPWQLAQALLPGMVERRFGRVLFVSSLAALTGGIIGPHYAASKAALHGLTHHLAARVAAQGVTVNAIAPALIAETRMLPGGDDPDELPAPIPVGRLGRPEEVAALAVTMLDNGYLTSKVIALDGGLYPA